MLDAILRDMRYATRVLRKTPAFTLAAVLTLALAIGVNTAVFSLVKAVLLTPLPYPDSNNLALLTRVVTDGRSTDQGQAMDGRTWELVRDTVASGKRAVFSGWTTGVNLVLRDAKGAETAHYAQQQRVGTGFFDVLGVPPMMGRELSPDEDRPNGPPAVVLSAALWRRALDADPTVLGRALMLRGEPYTIVGVMPDGFHTGIPADLWTALKPTTTGEGGGTNYTILVRVASDASRAAVLGEVQRAGEELLRGRKQNANVRISMSLVPLQSGMTAGLRQPILILWAAVGVVLLAASVNLAGLMLARASARTREIATRLALGSGRAVVLRQLLVEAIVLGLAGGALGIGIAYISIEGLTWLARETYEIWQPVALDATAIAVAATLSVTASLVFGLGPALQASRGTQGASFTGSRSVTDTSKHWPRRALVVVQVALGVILLVSAGLLLRSFNHLRTLDPGFDPQQLTVAAISLEDARYRTADRVARLAEEVTTTLQRTPGIESAALGLGIPYQRILNMGFRRLDGPEAALDADRGNITNATYVTGGFFDAMRIPLRRGRSIDARDVAASTPIVVVNEAFVRTYFKSSEPLDRHIRISGVDRQVVGIVGDVQVKPSWGNFGPLSTLPHAYVPVTQLNDGFVQLVHTWFQPTFVVRSSLQPARTAQAMREAVASIDPLLPIASVELMSEIQTAALVEQQLLATLIAGLAVAALIVAATGIHGLIATSVTERTREIGIRLALGSTIGQALRTLALPGVVLAAIGVGLGLVAALSSASLLNHFIWGVRASDPMTFGGVAVVLMLTAAAASVAPALRIVRLDPSKTLRAE